jgi:acetyl esterase/lipase
VKLVLLTISIAVAVMSQDILRLAAPPPGERMAYGRNPLQFAELRLPEGAGPHPVAVVIHGGFWRSAYNLDHISHLCVALNQAGLATWSLEYRRIGDAGGAWPGTFDDVAAGADYLKTAAAKHPLDLTRVVAVGHSAGGQLALWLGSRNVGDAIKLRGIVSLAGVADLRRAFDLKLSNTVVADLLGGSPDTVADRYKATSPAERLPLRAKQRLIHGTLDVNVPFEISKDYVAAAKSAGDDAVLIPLEGARHFELIDPRTKEFETVKRTVLELLK